MLTIQELFNLKTDILKSSKVKLVRHKDGRKEYKDVLKNRNELLEYQKEQKNDVFKGADYIVSFIGQESAKSLFFGVFKVNGVKTKNTKLYYDIEEVNICDEFKDRVIIDWGNNTRAWYQWYDKQEKQILEILPKGYLGEFPGLTNFVLDFYELKRLIKNPDANRDWKNNLSSINGIYMILDKKTGNQYIGSAYGNNGIWQRWEQYANTMHGGNKKLIELCNNTNDYQKNFQYTILQSLPSNLTSKEVVKIENLYKEKFGTRAHGLNEN
ncbi:GIY-YIG nuclease family protein [uncultured Maribacter sp.]|uniref:GIY-YIG nuclease family protein n=1 Tax=uncultured Maribacter sp. TaxID=431308 RepID=UPI002638CD1F|nr:GIY-YIG nuclease family protein [uncultured Maribacter sp.]